MLFDLVKIRIFEFPDLEKILFSGFFEFPDLEKIFVFLSSLT